MPVEWIKNAAKSVMPAGARRWLRIQQKHTTRGPVELWQTSPVSRQFGVDRGQPIDRHYIENFLKEHTEDIRGDVLEIAEDTYARRFGSSDVHQIHVLHSTPHAGPNVIVADLTNAGNIPDNSFDCIILTQTLQFIFDVPAALRQTRRILRPEGVLLATVSGISQISRYDMDRWGDYWRFTSLSMRKLLEQHFQHARFEITTFGNVLATISFLHGLASDELKPQELSLRDADYELVIAIRAIAEGHS